MRNWLHGQDQRAWTVTAWIKRVAGGSYTSVGVVDNGDCVAGPSYLLHSDVDASDNPTAVGGIATGSGFPATTTGEQVGLTFDFTVSGLGISTRIRSLAR